MARSKFLWMWQSGNGDKGTNCGTTGAFLLRKPQASLPGQCSCLSTAGPGDPARSRVYLQEYPAGKA